MNIALSKSDALHVDHWHGFMDDRHQAALYESWWHDDRVNYWRHTRLLAPVLEVLGGLKKTSWLTIGDGAGTDAWRLLKAGFGPVLATDLDTTVLERTKRLGHITDYQVANAERLPFADQSFDFVLCKEALHHMARPYAGIYECLRVARYGAIFIEPQDPWIDSPLRRDPQRPHYESVGNYVYQFSTREVEKIGYGMNLRCVITRGMVDIYIPNCEFAIKAKGNPIWEEISKKTDEAEALVQSKVAKGNYIQFLLMKQSVDPGLIELLAKQHPQWQFTRTDTNPYLKTNQ